MAQSRSYLHTLRNKVGIIYILGAIGKLYDPCVHMVCLALSGTSEFPKDRGKLLMLLCRPNPAA